MATDINTVTIVGRLTRDSELKYTNSGFAICNMGIAVNRSRKDGENWIEEANFFDVTLLGRRGEALSQYLTKGQQIAVTGELRQERWEKDGQKRSRVIIQASNVQLIGSRPQGLHQQSQDVNNSYPSANNNGGNGNFEDDIPF